MGKRRVLTVAFVHLLNSLALFFHQLNFPIGFVNRSCFGFMKKLILFAVVFCFGFALQAQAIPTDVVTLIEKNGCNACHKVDKKMVGPSWNDIAAKKYSKKKLVDLVYKPVPENWPGYVPMQPMPQVPKADAGKIADWIVKISK